MVSRSAEALSPGGLVWVLADDRAGNVSQCLGVAEALTVPFTVKTVRYTALAGLPNALRGASRLGIDPATRRALTPPWPSFVIAAGRRTAPLARWIKRKCGARLIQIMDPGWPGHRDFDLIAVPNHDGPMPAASNLLRVTGAPHRVTPERLGAEKAKWWERIAAFPGPRIALIVGGATKTHPFTVDSARRLARQAAEMARRSGGSLLVTTSRRTGKAAETALLSELPEPRWVYRWDEGGENPYFAFLAAADAIVVTGDSVSMCCEACATAAPVFIHAPEGSVADKHAALHQELYKLGLARPLSGKLESWTHPPLNAADTVAAEIRRRFGTELDGASPAGGRGIG